MTEVYEGMKVYLTKNFDKKNDFVNGMGATVVHFDASSRCLEVRTDTGKLLSVHLYTEPGENGKGNVTCFPVRVGYAGTIQKFQGATLDHITMWLDKDRAVLATRVPREENLIRASPVAGEPREKHPR